MIFTLVIGVLVYVALLWSHSTHITPDGQFYLAMGRGTLVPRPYACRSLPKALGSVTHWRVLHAASYLVALISLHLAGEQLGVNGTQCALGVLALPAFRQSVSWPVLLDMPILAVSSLVAALSGPYPVIALLLLMASGLAHERAPMWCAVFAVPFLPLPLAVVFVVIALVATLGTLAAGLESDDSGRTGIDWLDHPFKAALAKHRGTLTSYEVWMRPLGASLLGLATMSPWVIASMLMGYAGCAVAQDRARIYSYAAFPLTVVALQVAGPYAFLIPIINWFVPNTEV